LRELGVTGEAGAMRSDRLVPGAVAISAAALLSTLLTGCGPVDSAHQVIDRSKLVNELASRLDRASTLTYTAEYELADKEHTTVAQAQKPVRASYTYPAGKIATTLESTIDCRSGGDKLVCTVAPPQKPTSDTTAVFTTMRERGLVIPQQVIGLLTSASLAKRVPEIKTTSDIIAGEAATCVEVSGLTGQATNHFRACITDTGVLGSFDGRLDDRTADVTLVRYSSQVADDAFDAPEGAEIIDTRPAADR
jgi:hypothetical protein